MNATFLNANAFEKKLDKQRRTEFKAEIKKHRQDDPDFRFDDKFDDFYQLTSLKLFRSNHSLYSYRNELEQNKMVQEHADDVND